jgi:Caspase domain
MASSVFALIIGIDQYKSSKIWNLSSCVDDAVKMRRWLTNDLHVPRDHICMLTDSKATKGAIEDAFMSHLVNNPSIMTGDSIIIYFAGHGSSSIAPDRWQNRNPLHVEMLCPYDHGMRVRGGRVAGLTDWSVYAMISELSEVKGDNITLILDCCFSLSRNRSRASARPNTRWTPAGTSLTSDDLYAGLWRGALGRKLPSEGHGFYQKATGSHVTILACGQGESAIEDKAGGRFTMAFLAAKDTKPFHRTSYGQLIRDLTIHGGDQHPVCLGEHKNRIIFGGTAFTPDTRYVEAICVDRDVRIAAGAIHGVVEGTEFSMHEYNVHGSPNPVLATLQVSAVYPTWCLSKVKFQSQIPIKEGWARVTRWNNRTPFKVHLKRTCLSLRRWWNLRRKLPERSQQESSPGGCCIMRVAEAKQAHISLRSRPNCLSIERHDTLISDNCPQTVTVATRQPLDDVRVIDAAANFHLHLHRRNPTVPLHKKVVMGLHRLDSESWSPVEENLLEDGKVTLTHNDSFIYSVSLQNRADVDLWPYLFWMDATGYAIRPVYLPDPVAAMPPLPRGSRMTIGTGTVGSEALAFALHDGEPYNSGFLKLFLSTAYAPMNLVEQGSPTSAQQPLFDVSPSVGKSEVTPPKELWDTMMACVTVVRGGVKFN